MYVDSNKGAKMELSEVYFDAKLGTDKRPDWNDNGLGIKFTHWVVTLGYAGPDSGQADFVQRFDYWTGPAVGEPDKATFLSNVASDCSIWENDALDEFDMTYKQGKALEVQVEKVKRVFEDAYEDFWTTDWEDQ